MGPKDEKKDKTRLCFDLDPTQNELFNAVKKATTIGDISNQEWFRQTLIKLANEYGIDLKKYRGV